MSKADKGKGTEKMKVEPHGDNMIANSRGAIELLRRMTFETIIKIRSDTDAVENQRRIQEEKMKKERANAIQTEVITSHKKNVEIDWKWQELEEQEDCEELAEEIEEQKKECEQIIKQKDDLIDTFQTQIKQKHEEYVKALNQFNDDIDTLISEMHK